MILFSHQVNKVSGNWRSSGNHHMGIRDLQSRPSGQYLRNSQILLFFNRKNVLDGDNDRCPGYSNMCRGYMVRKGRGAYNERRQLWDSKVTSKSHRSA